MEFVWGFVVGFFVGGFIGILLMCILQSKNSGGERFLKMFLDTLIF